MNIREMVDSSIRVAREYGDTPLEIMISQDDMLNLMELCNKQRALNERIVEYMGIPVSITQVVVPVVRGRVRCP